MTMIHSIPLFLVWSGDTTQQEVERLSQGSEPDALRQLYQKIDRANKIVRAWVEGVGGSIISFNGSQGTAEMPAEDVADLPKIRVQYSEAIEAPFSVGVGSKLYEAQKALQVIQKRGGDQVLLYTPDLDKELNSDSDKEDPLSKSLKNGAIAGAMVAGLIAGKADAPTNVSEPTQIVKEPQIPKTWDPAGLHADLYPIAHLESSFGKNTVHQPNSKGEFETAVGAVGIKPQTAHEEFLRNPDLQKRFPTLFDKHQFLEAMNKDYGFYNQISSAYWNRIKAQLGNKIDRAAYAWRWGKTAALHAAPDHIRNDPYVKQYLALRDKGIYKMELENLATLQKDDGSVAPPKQEASEHSEGEAANHLFEENVNNRPRGDITQHLHKLASAQHASDNQEEAQEDKDKELTQIKSGVITVLQHVQKLQPQFEELQQSNPEVYKTLLEMIQGMIVMAKEFEPGPLNKSEDELTKGSFQRKLPFDPHRESHREEINNWQGDTDHLSRDKIPRLEGNGRIRALHKMHGLTKVRKNSQGEREFLLHRAVSRSDSKNKLLAYSIHNNIANDFIEWPGRTGQVVSEFIPESRIHHVLNQLGNTGAGVGVDGRRYDGVPLRGRNSHRNEAEVLVQNINYNPLPPAPSDIGFNPWGTIINKSEIQKDAEVIPFPGNPIPKHTYRKKASVDTIGTPYVIQQELKNLQRDPHKENLQNLINNTVVPDSVPQLSARGINGTDIYDYSHFLDPVHHNGYSIQIGYSPKKDGFTLGKLMHHGQEVGSSWTYPLTAQEDGKPLNPPKISNPIHKDVVNGPLLNAIAAHMKLAKRNKYQTMYDDNYGNNQLDKAVIGESGHRQHLHLPVGSKIDGEGKIKIQNPDGSSSWIQARSGQILSPIASQTLAGSSPVPNHPLSARSSNAKPENALQNLPKIGTSASVEQS